MRKANELRIIFNSLVSHLHSWVLAAILRFIRLCFYYLYPCEAVHVCSPALCPRAQSFGSRRASYAHDKAVNPALSAGRGFFVGKAHAGAAKRYKWIIHAIAKNNYTIPNRKISWIHSNKVWREEKYYNTFLRLELLRSLALSYLDDSSRENYMIRGLSSPIGFSSCPKMEPLVDEMAFSTDHLCSKCTKAIPRDWDKRLFGN